MKLIKLLLKLWKKKPREPSIGKINLSLEKSPLDERDDWYATVVSTIQKPQFYTIAQFCPPVKQQGTIGSCGSHAFCTAMEILQKKTEPRAQVPLSELFHYYRVRCSDYMNTLPDDSGQYLRDGAKVCAKEGVSPEKLCPYKSILFNKKPTLFAYSFAKFFRISKYSRCYSIDAIKQGLSENNPVVFAIKIQDDIFLTNTTGNVAGKGKLIGAHAVCAVGYDDTHSNPDGSKGAVNFVNSWGTGWGNKGYGWIGYNVFKINFIEAWKVVQ